jgi:hypothetical protein
MSKTKHLRISGPFSDDDLAEFVALLRKIDERNPTGIFRLSIIDEQIMMDDGEALIQKLLPPLPDRATSFARASYRDDGFPERHCDRCSMLYRGPAVYCSLECAVADAG